MGGGKSLIRRGSNGNSREKMAGIEGREDGKGEKRGWKGREERMERERREEEPKS